MINRKITIKLGTVSCRLLFLVAAMSNIELSAGAIWVVGTNISLLRIEP